MKTIFERIDELSKHPITCDFDGMLRLMDVHWKQGLSRRQITSLASKHGLIFNEDVVSFYERYNGIYFFDVADCQFNTLNEAIKLSSMKETHEDKIDKKLLHIGYYFGDDILMDCSDSENRILFSLEGIGNPNFTGYNFKEFLKESLDTNFVGIWETWEFQY